MSGSSAFAAGGPRVLVTRPERQARSFAELLARRGYAPVLDPALRIEPRAVRPRGAYDGVLLTSANGLLGAGELDRALPVWCVGEETARAARAAGFLDVEAAGGSASALADALRARSPGGRFLWLRGADARDAPFETLGPNFAIERAIAYRAAPIARASAQAIAAARQGALFAATFFSPRTAERWLERSKGEPLAEALAQMVAVALSERVCDALRDAGFRATRVAERADAAAMVDQLDDVRR